MVSPGLKQDLIRRERKREELPSRRRSRKKPITVNVQVLTGRRFQLVVDQLYDSLDDIREKIQSKEGIHPDQQLLLFNGLKIPDGTSCAEMQLREGSTLFLTLRNRGG